MDYIFENLMCCLIISHTSNKLLNWVIMLCKGVQREFWKSGQQFSALQKSRNFDSLSRKVFEFVEDWLKNGKKSINQKKTFIKMFKASPAQIELFTEMACVALTLHMSVVSIASFKTTLFIHWYENYEARFTALSSTRLGNVYFYVEF